MRPTGGIIPLEILTISRSIHLNLLVHRISRKQYGLRRGSFLEIYPQFEQPFVCLYRVFSLSLFFCIRKNISSSSHDILIIGINYSGLYREPFQSKQWHGELSPCEPTVSSVTCPCVSFTYRHRSSRAGLFIRHLNTISLAVHRFLKKPSF